MATIVFIYIYILTLPHFQIAYTIMCACYVYMFCFQRCAVYISMIKLK